MRHKNAVIAGAISLFLFFASLIATAKDLIELPANIAVIFNTAKPVIGAFTWLELTFLSVAVILLAYGFDLHRRGWQALRARIMPSNQTTAPPTVTPAVTQTKPPAPQSPDLPDTPLGKFVDDQLVSINEIDYLEAVGALFSDIRQRAVLGTIQVWGRENCPIGQRHTPITLIPEAHWKVAQIDVEEFLSDAETRRSRTEASRLVDRTYYSDLHLNHRQIEEAWPQTFVPLGEALRELYDATKSNPAIGVVITRKTEDLKFDWLASILWGKAPLQVKYKISNRYEALPKEEQRGRYVRFHNGQHALVYDHQGKEEIASTDIAVLRSDLAKAIAYFQVK
jgi:hypothetical protein